MNFIKPIRFRRKNIYNNIAKFRISTETSALKKSKLNVKTCKENVEKKAHTTNPCTEASIRTWLLRLHSYQNALAVTIWSVAKTCTWLSTDEHIVFSRHFNTIHFNHTTTTKTSMDHEKKQRQKMYKPKKKCLKFQFCTATVYSEFCSISPRWMNNVLFTNFNIFSTNSKKIYYSQLLKYNPNTHWNKKLLLLANTLVKWQEINLIAT